MTLARFLPIILVLAVAGSLAGKKVSPAGPGHDAHRHPDLRHPADRGRDPGRRPHLLPRPPARPDRAEPDHEALLRCAAWSLTSILAVIVFTLVFGLAYPLAMTGISQVVFPGKADGSKLTVNGKLVGSSLIGQSFSRPVIGKNGKPKLDEEGEEVLVPDKRYFQPRPSETGYSASVTYFSNSGPNSVEEREAVREALAAYVKLEKPYDKSLTKEDVPVDAITMSGSGVDPEISEANALIQAHRIAAVRKLPLSKVEELISDHTSSRFLGVFGEPGVNVLQLNLALDEEAPTQMTTETQARSLFDPEILRPALLESLRKLDPRVQARNPVMFVVEIGAVITTVAWLIQVFGGKPLGGGHEPAWFTFTRLVWLWLTVVFANLAEALAEGRGRAQAASLRAMRTETTAKLRDGGEKAGLRAGPR